MKIETTITRLVELEDKGKYDQQKSVLQALTVTELDYLKLSLSHLLMRVQQVLNEPEKSAEYHVERRCQHQGGDCEG